MIKSSQILVNRHHTPMISMNNYAIGKTAGVALCLAFFCFGLLMPASGQVISHTRPQQKSAKTEPPVMTAYVLGGVLQQYSMMPSGSLQPLRQPKAPLMGPDLYKMAFGLQSRTAYGLDIGTRRIFQFHITEDGWLMPLSIPAVKTEAGLLDVVLTPDNRFLYASNFDKGTLSQYRVQPNGVLTLLSPETLKVGASPRELFIHPTGRFLYTVNQNDHSISAFRITNTGQLVSLGLPMPSTGKPNILTFAPDGRAAYLCNWSPGSVSQYRIQDDGRLAPLAPPLMLDGGYTSVGVVISADRHAAYVSNSDGKLNQYHINADDSLSPLSPASLPTGSSEKLVITPSGKFVYASNGGNGTISQFGVNPDGTLTALSPPDVAVGTHPHPLAVDPTGRFLYTVTGDQNTDVQITQFGIGADGRLFPLTPPAVAINSGASLFAFITLPPAHATTPKHAPKHK